MPDTIAVDLSVPSIRNAIYRPYATYELRLKKIKLIYCLSCQPAENYSDNLTVRAISFILSSVFQSNFSLATYIAIHHFN